MGQRLYRKCELRMCFERQNLVIEPKGLNTVTPAKMKSFEKGICIMQADIGSMKQTLIGW